MKFRSMLVGLLATAMVLPVGAQEMNLTLDEAVKTAVKNNLGVQLQTYDYRILGEDALGQYGLFDWNLTSFFLTSKTEQATADVTQSSEREQQIFNVGLNHLFATGATMNVSFNNVKSTENAVNFTQPSFYSSSLGVNLTQPLLRNFGVDNTRRGITIAKNNLGVSHEAFRTLLLETVTQVESAYYDVTYSRLNLDVQKKSLDLAKEQERITQIRIDVGADAPLDILEPQVSIAQREQDVILAEAALRNNEDTLRRLMNLPVEEWDRELVTTENLDYEKMDIDAKQAASTALSVRPELVQARLRQRNQEILSNYASNQVRPQLDLTAGYQFSGLDPSYSEAVSQISGTDFPSWSVQLQFGLPILNTQARANARRAVLELERSHTSEEQTRQQILIEVRQAVRDIETAYKAIEATKAAREAAEKNLDAQKKRFDNGMSTNFDVLRVQQDLSNSESSEILSLTAYQKSIARYHRAIGDLLEERGIEMQAPAEYDLPDSSLADAGWAN